MRTQKPCDHGNTMGLYGQVVCVWCRAVVRQMSPEERRADTTYRTVVDPKAMVLVHKLLRAAGIKVPPDA